MPFGALFGSLVFGVVTTWIGWRLAHAPSAVDGLRGVSLIGLGLALALGLLLRRPWARWIGLIGAACLALESVATILQARGESLGMVGLLASLLTFVLLCVPKTGRFPDAAPPGRKRLWTGRALAGISFIALAGLIVASVISPAKELETAQTIPAGPLSSTRPPDPSDSKATWKKALPAKLEWLDFAPGMQKAKAAGKPVLVDFFAEWCGPCKMMERETFRDAKVVARLGDVVAVRVDAESDVIRDGVTGYDVAEQYRVEAYPTIALLDPSGRVLARFSGYRGPREFLQWLDAAIAKGTRSARVTAARP